MSVRQKAVRRIDINDGARVIETARGRDLLSALEDHDIHVPAACGGVGTCAMCKCEVTNGGGPLLSTEIGLVSDELAQQGYRLACQLKVENDLKIRIPDDILAIRKFSGTVRSNHGVATFIRELIVDLPPGMTLNFRAGDYVEVYVPNFEMSFRDLAIEDRYRDAWDKANLWDLKVKTDTPSFRAYSMANPPSENNRVVLNVRISTPPPQIPGAQPGISSTYIFSLKPGDSVSMSGPFGDFCTKDTEREMIFIGGGAGMAPLRSQLFDLFYTKKTQRKVSYWYGARSLREMFYEEDFRNVERENPNFKFHVALSEPLPEDNWKGLRGFIHQVVLENYLKNHEGPRQVEYYLCGPPPMIAAVNMMLHGLGVKREMIAFDEF